jgi:peptidoglycan/xylan/chitin deacetylase (PgdA/CDA1 family)
MTTTFSKRELLARTMDATGCGRLLRTVGSWSGVLVWNYHRIGTATGSVFDPDLFSATPEDFEQQVRFLKQNFDVIGVPDLESALRSRRRRCMMITFDDGYRDNFSVAYPILKSNKVPATFFVATGFIDRPRVAWWDELAWMTRATNLRSLPANEWIPSEIRLEHRARERAFQSLLTVYKSLPSALTLEYLQFLADALDTGRCPTSLVTDLWMTWDMLREMQTNGMTIGGHTVTHPILANMSADQQDWEIGECQRRIQQELRVPVRAFSYPIGKTTSFNEFTRAALQRHGFRWAFSFHGGYCQPGKIDRFALPRTAVETEIDSRMFRAIATLPQLFS